MKIVRKGTFETNSSSTHSITMCTKSDYDKWINGEMYYDGRKDEFVSKDEIEKEFMEHNPNFDKNNEKWIQKFENYLEDRDIYDSDSYDNYYSEFYEMFEDEFTTPNGEKVIAFGFYGSDY